MTLRTGFCSPLRSPRSRLLKTLPGKATGVLVLLASAFAILLGEINPSGGQIPPPGNKAAVAHRVIRVTEPEAKGVAEVAVAINPTNPDHMIAVSIAQMKGFPGITDFAYVTTDGGKTWKTAPCPNHNKRRQGDDVIAFTGDGLALHGYIAFDGNLGERPKKANSGIIIATSRDGLSWDGPIPVVDHVNTSRPFEDKPWIKADWGADSPHKGNIYVVWTKFDVYGSKNPDHHTHIYVSRSVDGGKSFAVPHRISEKPGDCEDKSSTLMGAVPAVGPKGEVYAAWAGPEGLVFAKSIDGGYTFGQNKVIATTPGGWDFSIKGLGRANGTPSMSVDVTKGKDRGSIYVNWGDTRFGDPDSFLVVSRDGGDTWSEPLRVNDDPKGNGKEQFFTWMVVDPVDGSVNVVFYDRRDLEGANTGLTLARSVDGGRTFVNHKINQEPFVCDRKGGFFGDYLGLDAFGGRVAALYMHYVEGPKVAVSAAIFDFELGTQVARGDKK
jgi:BNR/Asp-box repeat